MWKKKKTKKSERQWHVAGQRQIGSTVNVLLEQKHVEGEGVNYTDIWEKRIPSRENFKYIFRKARAYMAILGKGKETRNKEIEQGED